MKPTAMKCTCGETMQCGIEISPVTLFAHSIKPDSAMKELVFTCPACKYSERYYMRLR